MVLKTTAILAMCAIFFAAWGGDGMAKESAAQDAQKMTAEEAYKIAMEKRSNTEPIEERLAITKAFLEEYPESKHSASAISAVVYYMGERLGDMPGAVAYAEAIRKKISDPGIAASVDREMIVVYGDAGNTEKMLALAEQLAAAGELGFNSHWDVIEHAIEIEDWKLARDYCAKAKGMATAEAFRSDYPDYEFTDEEVAEAGRNRKGMLLVKDGWARANQGEVDEALVDFAAARDLIRRSYLDVPEYDLNLYWASTLIKKKDFEAAIALLAVEALVMRGDQAAARLKEAYVGIHGDDSGYDTYAAKLHRKVAKTIEDFELPDYDGKRHRLSSLKNKVTLVAFWFPT